ncbi:DinB/YfiT-like putative metal-dependent hydrolase [Plasmopara halstedii]|uniref:DinB/YfiT-like putative metal-dependent hydrolase n=1 Tax=Plasmopara halstedii TaxID=4781 RepID=A0A0P1AX30_PLAHL|nr:DinB/YfiT-like putative metal-dependent hydrolase [Plasmopara halstedii]CEG45972.1 DinB/YfiT-like putative metal-dependent hydrolase [Plasmopara halstedii]|eukprot:XP_024582341.1 DinB/YfiT-like putative metal-dependent hydrolase [Plasmopara halstedii]
MWLMSLLTEQRQQQHKRIAIRVKFDQAGGFPSVPRASTRNQSLANKTDRLREINTNRFIKQRDKNRRVLRYRIIHEAHHRDY